MSVLSPRNPCFFYWGDGIKNQDSKTSPRVSKEIRMCISVLYMLVQMEIHMHIHTCKPTIIRNHGFTHVADISADYHRFVSSLFQSCWCVSFSSQSSLVLMFSAFALSLISVIIWNRITLPTPLGGRILFVLCCSDKTPRPRQVIVEEFVWTQWF